MQRQKTNCEAGDATTDNKDTSVSVALAVGVDTLVKHEFAVLLGEVDLRGGSHRSRGRHCED